MSHESLSLKESNVTPVFLKTNSSFSPLCANAFMSGVYNRQDRKSRFVFKKAIISTDTTQIMSKR